MWVEHETRSFLTESVGRIYCLPPGFWSLVFAGPRLRSYQPCVANSDVGFRAQRYVRDLSPHVARAGRLRRDQKSPSEGALRSPSEKIAGLALPLVTTLVAQAHLGIRLSSAMFGQETLIDIEIQPMPNGESKLLSREEKQSQWLSPLLPRTTTSSPA